MGRSINYNSIDAHTTIHTYSADHRTVHPSNRFRHMCSTSTPDCIPSTDQLHTGLQKVQQSEHKRKPTSATHLFFFVVLLFIKQYRNKIAGVIAAPEMRVHITRRPV